METISFETKTLLATTGIFLGMLLMLEIGRRIGKAKLKEKSQSGVGTLEGAVFGLMGLFLAFSFSGAASRLEDRRILINNEANAIGTAFLRIQLLAPTDQEPMKVLFKQYLDARLESYGYLNSQPTNIKASSLDAKKYTKYQNEIWKKAVNGCQKSDAAIDACKLFLPALNTMFDIASTRKNAIDRHPPKIIFYLLYTLCLISALLAGFGMAVNKSRNLIHMIIFALVMSATLFVIQDLEYPRRGFITISKADKILIELRKSMD